MKQIEYTYKDQQNVHVIQAKVSQNSKIGIGYIIQTYHYSIDQVTQGDITLDKNNCLDCPFSFNQNDGKSGGCYTHKGMQFMGIKSMLKRLNKNYESICEFNQTEFDAFVESVKNQYPVDLVRFGAYGEPVLLGEKITSVLSDLGKKQTGYTHQYRNQGFNWSKDYFMASTHNLAEMLTATRLGFRNFTSIDKDQTVEGVNCPASKESGLNLSCVKCGLCNGKKTNIQKDIFILKH